MCRPQTGALCWRDIAGLGEAPKYPPIKAGQYIMQKLGLMWDQDPAEQTSKAAKRVEVLQA